MRDPVAEAGGGLADDRRAWGDWGPFRGPQKKTPVAEAGGGLADDHRAWGDWGPFRGPQKNR